MAKRPPCRVNLPFRGPVPVDPVPGAAGQTRVLLVHASLIPSASLPTFRITQAGVCVEDFGSLENLGIV